MRELCPAIQAPGIRSADTSPRPAFDHHAALNALNILVGELTMLGITLGYSAELFDESICLCHRIADGLRDRNRLGNWVVAAEPFSDAIESALSEALIAHAGNASDPEVAIGLGNIRETLAVLRSHAGDLSSAESPAPRWGAEPDPVRDTALLFPATCAA